MGPKRIFSNAIYFCSSSSGQWFAGLESLHSGHSSTRPQYPIQLHFYARRWKAFCHQVVSRQLRNIQIHAEQSSCTKENVSFGRVQRQCKYFSFSFFLLLSKKEYKVPLLVWKWKPFCDNRRYVHTPASHRFPTKTFLDTKLQICQFAVERSKPKKH